MGDQEFGQLQATRDAVLSEGGVFIARMSDLEKLLSDVARKAKWVLDFERCTLCLDEDGDTYSLRTLLEDPRTVPAVTLESGCH